MNKMDRSGLATLSDLDSAEWKTIYSLLEEEQSEFLAKEDHFRSSEYKWPHDSLHTWSRIWEYPYVYHHLDGYLKILMHDSRRIVADIGSGVTFFPFSVGRLGYHVHCLDIDAPCGPDIERAVAEVPHQPGKVDFRLISNGSLPLEDGEVDAVYCVSVLEHIPDFEHTVKEVFRVLKPNGLVILTIDLDLCGYMDIGVGRYYDLRNCLTELFDFKEPEITVHPLDVLQPRNGPFPYMKKSAWQKGKFYVKQWIKPLFGKEPRRTLPNLAVWCAVMTKREGPAD